VSARRSNPGQLVKRIPNEHYARVRVAVCVRVAV